MDALLWGLRTHSWYELTWAVVVTLVVGFALLQTDFPLLLARRFARAALGRTDGFRPAAPGARPTALVIIPSLLRGEDDLEAIRVTVESCGTNGYPSDLVIVASVDGRTENAALYAKLESWVARRRYPSSVRVHTTGTATRLGKMMAVEAGVTFTKQLVARGALSRFPDVYVSIDGDGTLGEQALERLVARLETPHPLTGNKRRVVSGKICIRPDLLWQGWRTFFSRQGQIFIQVAREFVVSNVARHNWKLTPKIGIPGALYCCWSEQLLVAPKYMGFMQTIRFVDWLRWWVGLGPPAFSESDAAPLPEALTGASDDTCMAFLASIASWKNGKLFFDAPRTPAHALARLFRAYFVERSHDYEPEARVYTYTPTTVRGLWKQRVRWNASRFECAGRFWRSFWFHWEIGVPVAAHLTFVLASVLEVTSYYVLLPYACLGDAGSVLAFALGYVAQMLGYTIYTVMALLLEREWRRFWRVLFCMPVVPIYLLFINFFGCVNGVTKDLLLFGNTTNFAPEWTLRKSGCKRVAIAFRIRRFLALCIRSALKGDVPLGTFWLGWTETPWTPSGFDGWTTGKPARSIILGAPSEVGRRAPARVVPLHAGDRRTETKRAA